MKGGAQHELPNIHQFGPAQHMRRHDPELQEVRNKEVLRVRQLANLRSKSASPVISKQKAVPSPPPPPRPQFSLGGGGSSPNLHEFATREQLARLDAARENLDIHVEQSLEKLASFTNAQQQSLEDWVEKKMESLEEKLVAAVTTVQQTRDVLDSAVSSISTAGKPDNKADIDSRLREKLTSLEERLATCNLVETEMQNHIQSLEQRLTPEHATLRQQVGPAQTVLLEAVMAKVPALEVDIGGLRRSLEERSASKDTQEEIWSNQFGRLQSAVSEMTGQLEVLSETRQADAEKAALEERFSALQAQLTSASASHAALEAALSAMAQRQSAGEEKTADRDLKDRIVDLEARCAALQVLLDNKVVALDAKMLRNDIRCEAYEKRLEESEGRGEKMVGEVQGLKLKHDSFATDLHQTAHHIQAVLDRRGAIEEQLRAAAADATQVQDVKVELSEQIQATVASVLDLRRNIEEELHATASAVQALVNKSTEQIGELRSKIEGSDPSAFERGFVSRKEFVHLQAHVEGGFDAMLVQLEAQRWMAQESGVAADKIVQAFALNMDDRIAHLEHRLAHLAVIPRRALRSAQEHNFKMLKVSFDLWARGSNAHCLRVSPSKVSEESCPQDDTMGASTPSVSSVEAGH